MEKDTNVKQTQVSFLKNLRKFFLGNRLRTISIVIILGVIGFFVWSKTNGSKQSQQYQTAVVTKGTLISSVTESGQVVASNRVEITTQASGVINHVYVKDGDTVTAGQIIADMTLDTDGAQRQAQAWASYLTAKDGLNSANNQLYSLQSTMFTDWQKYLSLAQNGTYQNGDGSANIQNRQAAEFISSQDDWSAAEGAYKNQQGVVAQSQAALNSSYLAYQSTSATIVSPGAGVITDIVMTPGIKITSSATSGNSGTTVASQPVASIKTEGTPVVSVSLSEVDAVKVQGGQKATITFDALPDQTFTGKVTGIDTTGVVSAGVTSYPATIVLDIPNNKILPNMSVTASIIIDIKNDVLTVPIAAVQTTGGQSTVRIVKNGQITPIPVMTGESSATDTEITAGLSEGDTVVVGFLSTQSSGSTTSPFSRSLFGGGGFGGGARVGGGGGRGG